MFSHWGDLDRTFVALDQFRKRMDWVFEDLNSARDFSGMNQFPPTNIYDAGQSFVLQVELPGLTEKELEIFVHQNVVTLRGERKTDIPEGYSVHRRERAPYRFARSFQLNSKLDPEKVTAELKNGVLTVTLAKATEALPKQIAVKVS